MSDIEEDYLDDLDEDFGMSSSGEEPEENLPTSHDNLEPSATNKVKDATQERQSELNLLFEKGNVLEYFTNLQLLCTSNQMNPHEVENPEELSNISQESKHIIALLKNGNQKQFVEILPLLNEILPSIRNDIEKLHIYLTIKYSERFPELESLLPDFIEYANCIRTLEQHDITDESNVVSTLSDDTKLTQEQIMVIAMTIKTGFKKNANTITFNQENIFKAVELSNSLKEVRDTISEFMFTNIHFIAPNLTALIGPKVTSLLIGHAGSVLALSEIPSCNLASIGKKKYQSHIQQTKLGGVRQEGFIYHSDFIQSQDIGIHKQMLRMTCAKISLASRVDASQVNNIDNESSSNDSLGLKWKEELLKKVRKLKDAPAMANTKALPIPEDKPKKKRAGRKFRKYKEQFKLSHLRQLQNRVEFGKQETTVTDAFGEEVGLGMSKSSLSINGDSARLANGNVNNNAKLSKKMKSRIKEANEQSNEYLLSLTDDHFTSSTLNPNEPPAKKLKSSNPNEWYSHHL